MDGTLGATSADRDVVNLLRRSGKPVIYVANKADNQGRAAAAADLHELGLGSFIPVSALHGLGIAELERALAEALEPHSARSSPGRRGPEQAPSRHRWPPQCW